MIFVEMVDKNAESSVNCQLDRRLRSYIRALVIGALPLVGACGVRESAGADRTANRLLHVSILSSPTDNRLAPAREALAHWNAEFQRLGLTVHLDSGAVKNDSVPDAALRAASEATPYNGPAVGRLRMMVANMPGDIVITFSNTDLVSFSAQWQSGGKGIVGVRRSDIPPLTLPNTIRNVVAHELGHVFGLSHNTDSTTLMCGRPSPCRPSAFAAATTHFFPLTATDERTLRQRWR